MCFSVEASLATGAVLMPVGIYCVHRAWHVDHDYLALAITPLVFAVQQICEAFVWIGIRSEDPALTGTAALCFLFFALVWWPVWLPWTGRALAWRRAHKQAFATLAFVALVASSIAYLPLASTSRDCLHVTVAGHSIRYEFESMLAFGAIPRGFWQAAYLLAVCVPLLVAHDRAVRLFGGAVAASAVTAHVAFTYAFVSVWCLFAGILSAWLCILFHRLRPSPDAVPAPAVQSIPAPGFLRPDRGRSPR